MHVLPLGLVLKAGTWYLVARNGKAIRTYRVGSIEEAEISDETFVRPKDFDLATHWEKARRDYEDGLWRGHADIRLSPRGVALLALLGSHVEQAARETAKPEADGWVRCMIPIESETFGVRELIRLCEEVEVIGPPSLRDRMTTTLAAMASRHAGPNADKSRARRRNNQAE
jgi:predicted DNA-binding transcriptional regulator YafY